MSTMTPDDYYGQSSITLALIAMFSAVMSPMLMAWLTNRYRSQERAEDYRRQDLVSARAEAVAARAELVATKVDRSTVTITAANQQIVRQSEDNSGKLDVIHTLVNSSLTAAKQSEMNAMVALLGFMRKDPYGNANDIAETEFAIAKLRVIIADMSAAAETVNKQITVQTQKAASVGEERKPAPSNDIVENIAAAQAGIVAADAKVDKAAMAVTPVRGPVDVTPVDVVLSGTMDVIKSKP